MPTFTIDWGAITAITTTIGGVLIAYIAYRQKQIDNKLEKDRLEAKERQEMLDRNLELARIEKDKQGKRLRRVGRMTKEIVKKTDVQTKMIDDTCRAVDEVKKQTNGMTERLVAAEAHKSRLEGRVEGAAEAKATAEVVAAVVKEAVKEATLPTPPQPVVVTNSEPIPVTDEGRA
jgi:hypothetical protein